MLKLDSILSLQENSVILDNTTLFTCHPLRTGKADTGWPTKSWSKHLIDWGMSNLVEAMILYENIYVDGHSRYQAPIVEEIAEQFDGLIKGIDLNQFRESIFSDLTSMLNENRDLAWTLYILATEYRKSGLEEKLHISHIYDFLQQETQARNRSEYLPEECPVEPIVFRTYFYLVISAIGKMPYVPYPIRNPILYTLSGLVNYPDIEGEKPYEYYKKIAKNILQSFDDHVRKAISESLMKSSLGFPPLPMPTFWEVVKEASGGERTKIVKLVKRLRKKAKPFREYINRLTNSYKNGDIEFLQREARQIGNLQVHWVNDLELPYVVWKKIILPLTIKFPLVEIGKLEVPLKFPTLNPYKKTHVTFLHDWVVRRF